MRWSIGTVAMLLLAACGDPKPARMDVTNVRLEGDPGTQRLFYTVQPYDDDGQAFMARGSTSARIVEGATEVCSFGARERAFAADLGEVELFTSPCPPPAGGVAREIEITLTSEGATLTTRVPVPGDAVWIDPAQIAALQAESERLEQERAASAQALRDRTPRDAFEDYVASFRRALGAVPEEGAVEAPPCIRDVIDQGPSFEGSSIYEPWARAVVAAESLADAPTLPTADEDPRAFVSRSPLSAVLELLRTGNENLDVPTNRIVPGEANQGFRNVHRNLAQDGPLVRIVRVTAHQSPVVERAGSRDFVFNPPGQVSATIYIVDRRSGELKCTATVNAANSENYRWQDDHAESDLSTAQSYANGDLHANFFSELARLSPPS